MVSETMLHKLLVSGRSDIGLVRQNNEDVWVQLPEVNFFAIADGMGGHQAGEVAARNAIDDLCRTMSKKNASEYQKMTLKEIGELLRKAIRHANTLTFKLSKLNPEYRGMGTTLCCMQFHPEGIVYAHVGDSRIYRLRAGQLVQLTKDHSLLSDLVDQGGINQEEIADFQYKNVITKAIGTEHKIDPSIAIADLLPNDYYLMCSDGLSDLLSTNDIIDILTKNGKVSQAVDALIATANRKGGRDNITVLLIKIEDLDESENIPG